MDVDRRFVADVRDPDPVVAIRPWDWPREHLASECSSPIDLIPGRERVVGIAGPCNAGLLGERLCVYEQGASLPGRYGNALRQVNLIELVLGAALRCRRRCRLTGTLRIAPSRRNSRDDGSRTPTRLHAAECCTAGPFACDTVPVRWGNAAADLQRRRS